MNKCIFLGNLTKDMETRYSASGSAVSKGGMALNAGKDHTDFINIAAFGKVAEFCEKYGKKGRKFLIEAHVQTGSYDNKEGKKVYTTDFVIDHMEFADAKPQQEAQPQPKNETGFMSIPEDLPDLPFA